MKIDRTVQLNTCIPYNSTPVIFFLSLSHLISCHWKRGLDVYFHYGLISLLTIALNFRKLDIHLVHHKPQTIFFLMNYNVMEKGGLMDNFIMDLQQKDHVYMQNTILLICFYLMWFLGGRYHYNEITCFKLKVKKLKFFLAFLFLKSKWSVVTGKVSGLNWI